MRPARFGSLKLVLTAIMLLWASIVVTPAKAESVKYIFSGEVETIGTNLLGTNSALGQSGTENRANSTDTKTLFDGSYIFDPTVASSPTMLPTNVARYAGAISQFQFTIHSNTTVQSVDYNSTTISPSHTIDVGNGAATPYTAHFLNLDDPLNPMQSDPYPVDSYTVILSTFSGNSVGSFDPLGLEFNYIHANGNGSQGFDPDGPFSGLGLPVTPPGLNWHDGHAPFSTLRVIFSGAAQSVVDVRISDIHLVATPLPPAVILFGAGLVALIGLGARNWRQKRDGLVVGARIS